MPDPVSERLGALEARYQDAFALDARVTKLEKATAERKPKGETFREWVGTVAPLVLSAVLFGVGYKVNESINQAFKREELDLAYAHELRDLVNGFDTAGDDEAKLNANAIGLSLFGKHAITPLIERLTKGDVATRAAETGLRLIGTGAPLDACPRFAQVLEDRAHLYRWQTHKTIIRVMGQSNCAQQAPLLERYQADLTAAASDEAATEKFAARFDGRGFDKEGIKALQAELADALDSIGPRVTP